MKRKFTLLIAALALLTMIVQPGRAWGQSRTETTTTYTFTSKSWTATSGGSAANWTSGQDGSGFSNNGIQVTTNSTGANGTSPVSFTNVTKIVATYNTNKSKGAGTIVAKIGSNDGVTKNWAYSTGDGTQAFYTVQWDYTTPQSGNVKITCNTTTNSIYLVSVAITTDDGTSPSISAANVEIAYDVEEGSIAYTLNNATGNVNASITTGGDWLTSLGTITATEVPFTCSTNEGAAARTATVTLSYTGASNKVVTITQAGNPNAPGTQNNPYTVAQARAAIDAGTGVTGVYATGIVSAIPTAWSTQHNNITFNIVDESGDEDFLQAFRCVSTTSADASTVAVGDIVVVYGNMLLYQSTTYEFAQGCQLISLEHPSTPYFTANDVNITYDATAGSIAYTVENSVQGGQVTAATTSTWLTLGTDFTSPITFTCDANEAGERTATVTLTYTYGAKTTVTKDVTVTQAGNPNVFDNISDITEVGTAYSVKGTVVAINSRGFVMGDGTGYVYYYKNGTPEQAVNDKITLSGTTGTYGHIIQFTGTPTIAASETSNYDGNPAATVITAVPDYSTGYHLSTYLEFEGALEKSGSNYLITVGEGENNQIQISYPTTAQGTALTALDGKTVHIKGYFSGINSSSKFTVMLESAVEVAVPSITLAQYEYNLNADGGDAELPVTYTNMPANPQAVVIFYEANGETALTENPTWITAEINDNYNIAGHIDVNEGEARTAYFKVKGIDADNNAVYSNLVTINQAASAGPSIEFTTTSYNLVADGESKTISFDYEGLGNNPTFEVRFYDATGETITTYEWISGGITQGDKVTVTAVANDGEARTAYFRVYGENGAVNTESNLVTITQAAYVVDYATLPFEYGGGELSDFAALNGTSYSLDNETSYAASNAPYQIKFTKTGDYLQVKCNEQPGIVTIGVKVFNSSNDDPKITVQGSTDGETFTDIQDLTIDAGTTGTRTLVTTESFNTAHRYVRLVFTKTVNVGVGPITIAQVDNTPSITAEDVNIAYDATEGSIAYTINNPVAGGNFQAIPQTGGDRFIIGEIGENTIPFTCPVNTESNEQTATIELTYTYNRATVSKVVTITQAAAPATMYTVHFTLNGGTFVPNDDFTAEIVEIAAGTYTLPSATKAGYDFTGWNDGDQTYAAGDEYTVSADVDFTAQWTESTTGTISFNNTASGTAINAASVTGDDSMGNTWTITTEGTTSFTANSAYYQVGSGNSPATSITFTMTLPQQKIISAFEAKFGGFNGTVGDIALTVGNTTVGSGSLNGSTDVIIAATNTTEVGTVLTVTVTNIAKGVKCYYISYTLSDAPVVPVIDATAGSALAYYATAGSIIYEIANYEAGTMTATTTADWINALVVTTPTAEDGEVTFNVTENTSNESRSATVTLSFTYGDPAATVTKDVTVTQNGQPSITVTPATANVAFAGSAPEFAVTYESLEIDDADDFDVEFYETSTSTTAGTQPTWITNVVITENTTDGFTLTVTVAANDGAARDAYLKVYAAGDSDYIYSNIVTISQAAYTQLATYSLVTNVNQIVSGKHYLFVGYKGEVAYAMGYDKGNNRNAIEVTVDNNTIPETVGAYEFVINNSGEDWTIYDNNVQELNTNDTYGFLYAAGGTSNNYLKTRTTNNDDKGIWTITIDDETHVASITAKSTGRNKMRFNDGNSPLFSCYSDGQKDIYLYVKDNDHNLEYYGSEITIDNETLANNSVVVGNGSVVTFNGTNANADKLIIEDGGQLIHTGDVQATLLKDYDAAPWPSSKGVDGWYTIASPVNGADVSVMTTTANYDFYKYDEAEYKWLNQKVAAHGITTFEQGVGYLYATSEDKQGSFAGTMKATNANIEKDLSYACTVASLKGFNLMGNPFTRNLTNGDVKLGDSYLTTYYVVEGGSELVARQIDTYPIKPGQGFMVQATAENQKLVFNPGSAKGHSANNGYISIAVGNESFNDMAYINVANGNTLRKMTLNADGPKVYVMNNNLDYAAARVEGLSGSMPVCFQTKNIGTYTITIQANELDVEYLHLIDNVLHEDIDMLLEPSYSFIASGHDYAARFTLVFKANANIDEIEVNDNFAYQNGSDIIVNGNGELQVFDVTGRMVMNTKINGIQTVNVPATGMYIFRMVGESVQTQKIVVR